MLRKLYLSALAFGLAIVPLAASAQCPSGYAQLTATLIGASHPLATGVLTITAIDASQNPLNFSVQGGGVWLMKPVQVPIVNGAITQLLCLPRTDLSSVIVGYHIIARDTSPTGGNAKVLDFTNVAVTTTPWSLDSYSFTPPVNPWTLLPPAQGGSGTFAGGDVTGATDFLNTVTLNADPTAALQAATKQYVDAHAGGSGNFTGGTVSGATTFQAMTTFGVNGLQVGTDADNSGFTDLTFNGVHTNAGRVGCYGSSSSSTMFCGAPTGGGFDFNGGTGAAFNMHLPLILGADPSTGLQAATKQYVDAHAGAAAVAFASQYSFPGSTFLGDSITCGEGSASFSGSVGSADVSSNGVPNGGYAWLVGEQLGPVSSITNLCQGGAHMADVVAGHMLLGTKPEYAQQPTAFASAGINDSGQFGTSSNALANYTAEINAVTAWMTTPASSKVMAQSCTQTPASSGTIHAAALGNVSGATLTQSGDVVSCAITTTGGPLAVVYRAIDSNSTGTATLTIDGVSEGTLTSSGAGGVSIAGESVSQTEFAQTYAVAAGTHTVVLTGTMTGSGTFGLDYVATPYTGPAVVGEPRLVWVGLPYWPAGDTPVATYNATMQSTVATLTAQGWPVVFANTRSEFNNSSDVSGSSTTCRDGSTTTGASEANHPNDCGYMAMRDVVLKAVAANPVSYFQNSTAAQSTFIKCDSSNCTMSPGQTVALVGTGLTVTLPAIPAIPSSEQTVGTTQIVTVNCGLSAITGSCTVAVPSGWSLGKVGAAYTANGTMTIPASQAVSFASYNVTSVGTPDWIEVGSSGTSSGGGGGGAPSGAATVYGTYISGTVTFDPYGFDLAYVTGNATITIAASHYTGAYGAQQIIRIVNFGNNTVTLTGASSSDPLQFAGSSYTTYCASGCTNTTYTLAGNHTVEFISNNGGWIFTSVSANQ